jgi:hypothetical protein
MLVWAVHDGGYDADTWYWGALVMLALLTAVVVGRGLGAVAISRPARVALIAFAVYVAWSYLSIAWAQSPGDALEGSNRALLYLLVFATMLILPWTSRGVLVALLTFTLGVGVVAIVLLFRLASGHDVASLVIDGRLAAPTGYFNSTAALFTIETLVAIALASRRELPGPLRGVLIAFACAGLQLAVIVQSRGWLFTLPFVALVTIVILPDRLRVATAAVIPVVATVAPVHRLLAVYQKTPGPTLTHDASSAGHSALLICVLAFFVATLIAWAESLLPVPRPNAARKRLVAAIVAGLAVLAVCAGALAATHGHPFRFIERQWNGFSHPTTTATGSHFTDVGSGRYDFWRVSLDAFRAHPIGGLGQDNFADYYITRRHTAEEPAWTHSLELRLLVHTGIVGFLLFAVFLVAAIAAALRARRRRGLEAMIAAAALLPLVVWLIHGSIDWFWEIPALTGPALGFLAMAGALGARDREAAGAVSERESDATTTGPVVDAATRPVVYATTRPAVRAGTVAAGVLTLIAAVVVLGFPYLAVREESVASDLRPSDPAKALSDLSTAANLNPLSAVPGRVAGTIALEDGQYATALARFGQSIDRERGGWYSWLGRGLAASALGQRELARHDFEAAAAINPSEPVIREALAQVDSKQPLSPSVALQRLALSL